MGCLKLTYYPENHLEDTLYARQNRVWEVYIREEYTPWGETSFGSYGKKKYRFNGKELDSESSLYAYGARYYAPWMCRFIQVDPQAGKYMQQSSYAYADNSPVCKMDINGEGTGDDGGGGGGGGGESIGSQTRDNTGTSGTVVTREMMQAVNNGASNENSAVPEQKDFSNISVVEPAKKDNTRQAYTEKANLRTGAAVNTQKAAQANRSAAAEKRVSEAPSLTATPRISEELRTLNRRQRTWEKNVIQNPNSIFNPVNYNRTEMRLARASGQGLVMGAEIATGELALAKAVQLYRGLRYGAEAAKTSSRAFFSGAGTEARAINEGFTTLSQTRAGQNLMKMTEGMPYYPGSQAYNWWARLSSTYAKGIPKGSNVNVFLNNPSPTGIWNAVEKPILQQRGINIIYK